MSRSPSRKGRRRSPARTPSPVSYRHSSRWSSHRSRSPAYVHSHPRRKSRSLSPRRGKRRLSRSPLIHKSRSPSLLSLERKRAVDRGREQEEEVKKKRQQEAELKLIEEETARRVEGAIRAMVQEALVSDDLKREVELKVEEGRKKILEDIANQLQQEKQAALAAARKKEEKIQKEKEELEKMLDDNRRKIEESQRRAAEEQARKEEERYRELETLQRHKEEQLRRRKLEEEQSRNEQMKILGKKNTRPKLSFALGSK
ncbi:unnamed protein product [Calypogeia fissa]